MQKSDSTNTLEETINISNNKNQSEIEKIQLLPKNPLKKSFSEDTVTTIAEHEIPLTPPTKVKSRSRLSSVFRSLRGTKSSKKSSIDPTESGLITSGEEIEIDEEDKQKKKIKLSKKFSLNIKKYRVTPTKKTTSENQEEKQKQKTINATLSTTQPQNQQITDSVSSSKLNVSQVSLIDLPSDNETTDNDDKSKGVKFSKEKQKKTIKEKFTLKNHHDNQSDKKENKRDIKQKITTNNQLFNEPESSLKFDKVRRIQITIQGKKVEHINLNRDKLPTTTTSISGENDYLTATEVDQTLSKRTSSLSPSSASSRKLIVSEQQSHSTSASPTVSKRQSRRKIKSNLKSTDKDKSQELDKKEVEQEKLIITQSLRDTPPSERAPPKPQLIPDKSPELNRGAIKKTSKQSNFDESLMQKSDKSPSPLERGRRYPRSIRQSDEEPLILDKVKRLSPIPKTGNNLQNPNLSGSIGVVEAKEIIFDTSNYPPLPPTPPTPPKNPSLFLTSSSGDNIKPIEFIVGKIIRPQSVSLSHITDNQQPNSILIGSDTPNSTEILVGKSENIFKYPIETEYYSDEEERALIEGINRDYMSGISEYSLDSELIAVQQQENLVVMPAFGDLTMDNEVAPIMTTSGDKREHLYKILIIGELGTGKTSFIKRYVHKFFSQNYRATIGVDFALKVLHWDQNTIIRLQLWDIAGQERFGNMTRVYYKDAVGAFIVFDVTRSGTFDCVTKWKEDLDSKVQLPDGSPIPCILLANKCDQDKQGLVTNPEKMDEYVKANGFAGWFETSAKENINIDEAARALVNKILLNDKLISVSDLDGEKIELAGSGSGYGSSGGKKKECAC